LVLGGNGGRGRGRRARTARALAIEYQMSKSQEEKQKRTRDEIHHQLKALDAVSVLEPPASSGSSLGMGSDHRGE
jgi:hypothetical protein